MRFFLVLFVCFQSHIITRSFSEEISGYTTLSPPDTEGSVGTEVQIIAETSTEVVTEITATNSITESQLFPDETTDFRETTEITDLPSSTGLSTLKQEEERSTFFMPEDQTVPSERTTNFEEQNNTGSKTTGLNFENIDTSVTDQVWEIPTVVPSDSNKTESFTYEQTAKSFDITSLDDFDPENSSRLPEATTLTKEESDFPPTTTDHRRISSKKVEDCSLGMVCVPITNSCKCTHRETEEDYISEYTREPSLSWPYNTHIVKDNENWETKEENLTEYTREPTPLRINNTRPVKENYDGEENSQLAYRKLFDLTPGDQSGSVATLAFTPNVEIVEWFQIYESKFKRFLATRLAATWVKSSNETERFSNPLSHILYVTPSPFQTANSMVVSFLVQNPFGDSSENFLRAEDVLDCVRGEWVELEAQLQLNVSFMKIGFPYEILQRENCKILGNLNESDVKLLLLGMLILSTCSLLAAIVAITLQHRAKRSTFLDLSAMRRLPYGHPAAVLVRSPGDGTIGGRDLASDQQCKEEELDREQWMASHSQRGDNSNGGRSSTEKTVMVEMQAPNKIDNPETPF